MAPDQSLGSLEEQEADMASLFGEDNELEAELARELESASLDVPDAHSQQPEEQNEDNDDDEIPGPLQQAQRAFQPLFQNMDHASDAYVTWVSSGNEAVEPGTNDRLRNTRTPNDNALVERIYYGYWDTTNTLESNLSPGDIQDVDLQLIGWRLVDFVYKAQAGETSLRPTYSGSRVKHQKFDSFMERFNAVVECLTKSKQICKNILDSDEYMARLSWNPQLEYRRKINNAAGNRRRNFQNQTTTALTKAGIVQLSKEGNVTAHADKITSSGGTQIVLGKMALPRQSKLLQEELENVPIRESKSDTTKCQKEMGIQRKRVNDAGKQRKRPSKRARAEAAGSDAPAQQMPAIPYPAHQEHAVPNASQQEQAVPYPVQQEHAVPNAAQQEQAVPYPVQQEPNIMDHAQQEHAVPHAAQTDNAVPYPYQEEPNIMDYAQQEHTVPYIFQQEQAIMDPVQQEQAVPYPYQEEQAIMDPVQQEQAVPYPYQEEPDIMDHAEQDYDLSFLDQEQPAFPELQAPIAQNLGDVNHMSVGNQADHLQMPDYGFNAGQGMYNAAIAAQQIPQHQNLDPRMLARAPGPAVAQNPGRRRYGQRPRSQRSTRSGGLLQVARELRDYPAPPMPDPHWTRHQPQHGQVASNGNDAYSYPTSHNQPFNPNEYHPSPAVQAGAQGSSTAAPASEQECPMHLYRAMAIWPPPTKIKVLSNNCSLAACKTLD
ncbi:uncharacterized protein PG998_004471 [Apiospora kogelbergensis]|uniref:uncharacterized protein n=1 Tax=Apiospora kogelbergensis TaxID=1337665 RepID=UPI00312EB5B0